MNKNSDLRTLRKMNPLEEEGGVALFDKIISNRREIWGEGGQEKFGRHGAGLFVIRQESALCHYLGCDGRVRVWPIYMVILLVSAVLRQLIPIICGVGCINTIDTKDNHLGCRPH
jgi:hypothetical protein